MRPFDSSVSLGMADLERCIRPGAEVGNVALRFAHQPNLFASGYVLSAAIIAQSVARRLISPGAAASLDYVVIDYDTADDERTFRAPVPRMIPSPDISYYRVITRRDAKDRLACGIESSVILKNLAGLHRSMLAGNLSLRHALSRTRFPVTSRSRCRSIVSRSVDALEYFLSSSPRFSDATALHNAWVLQEVFRCTDVRVIAGYEWLARYARPRLSLTMELLRANPGLGDGFIWAICEQCLRRIHTRSYIVGEEIVIEKSQCRFCQTWSETAPLRFDDTIESPVGPCPKFVPTVHLDDILDRLIGDHDVSVYYPGSYSHTQESGKILEQAQRAGLRTARLPAADWCPTRSELATIWDTGVPDSRFLGLLGRASACVAWSLMPNDFGEIFQDRIDFLWGRR